MAELGQGGCVAGGGGGGTPPCPSAPGGGFSALPGLFCRRSHRVCHLLPIPLGAEGDVWSLLPAWGPACSLGRALTPEIGGGRSPSKKSCLDPAKSEKAAVTEKFLTCEKGKVRHAAIQGLYLTKGWYDVILLAHGVRHLLRVAAASSLRQKRASCEIRFKEGLFNGLKCSWSRMA